jgi:hypothetical protein
MKFADPRHSCRGLYGGVQNHTAANPLCDKDLRREMLVNVFHTSSSEGANESFTGGSSSLLEQG